MKHYDAIVLGVGGVGSAALYHLARRGASALGIDRFTPGHDRGSSHGQSRLIRQAYYEHPDYVPLVQRAFALWHDLETECGQQLYHQVGLLQVGPPEGEVLRGVRASAALHGLPIENLSAREASERFAGFYVPDDCEAVFETRAGYLLVEQAVEAHTALAQQRGAELRVGETIVGWRCDDGTVQVTTDRETYRADRLIVSPGAWAGALLAQLGIAFEVRRKPLYWFRTRGETYRPERGTPGFLFDLPDGCFYGMPQIDALGLKAAEHSGGQAVADPLNVDRENHPDEERRVADFLTRHLVECTREVTQHAVCMYTMTADAHFVVDRHPEFPQVAFAAGLSGHGFKFTTVLGEVLCQLALDGRGALPIDFLSASRPALRGIGL